MFHQSFLIEKNRGLKLKVFITPLTLGENDVSGRCVDYETELSAVREDLVDSLNAWVVRAQEKSELRKDFATDNDPAVIYFRRGVPALYPGKNTPSNRPIDRNTHGHSSLSLKGRPMRKRCWPCSPRIVRVAFKS